MTYLMREVAVAQCGADWILPLDADEFVATAAGASLREALREESTPVSMRWVTYVPHPSDDPGDRNPATRIRHRASTEDEWSKVLVPAALASRETVRLGQGNHHVELEGTACTAVPLSGFHLAHLPIRSATQFAAKVAVTELQFLAMHERNAGWGAHVRRFYDLLKSDANRFDAACQDAALEYAHLGGRPPPRHAVYDPLPYRGGPLRYTEPERPDALRQILEYAEHLARAHAAATGDLVRVRSEHAADVRELSRRQDEEVALSACMRVLDDGRRQAEQARRVAEAECQRQRGERAYRLAAGARAIWHLAGRIARADSAGAAHQIEALRAAFRKAAPAGQSRPAPPPSEGTTACND
jgi:hypothetical protein